MNNHPPKPELCPTCARHVERSPVKWALVGGLRVGMNPPTPIEWQLRPKDEVAVQERRTKELQRLAGACRLIHDLKEHVTDPIALKRINRFLGLS